MGWTPFERVVQDLRYGLRQLRRTPSFAVVAVLTLALGIAPWRWSSVWSTTPCFIHSRTRMRTESAHSQSRSCGNSGRILLSAAEFMDYQEQSHVFSDMAGIAPGPVLYAAREATQELNGACVTTNTFQFLGVALVLGRWITRDDGSPDAPPVFPMNYRMWQEQFQGDTKILGTSFTLNSVARQLIGIMPPRFQYFGVDVYLPMTLSHGGAYAPGWLLGGDLGAPPYFFVEERRKPGAGL